MSADSAANEDTPSENNDASPVGGRGRTGRAGMAGVVIGAGALVGAVAMLSGFASAAAPAPATAPASGEADGIDAALVDDSNDSSADEESVIPDEALDDYFACTDGVISGHFGVEDFAEAEEVLEDLTDAEWEKLESELEAIESEFEACEDQLPAGVDADDLDDLEAEWDERWEDDWEDEWVEPLAEGEGFVAVETSDGAEFAEFGEGDGSITITKADGEVDVAIEGDVIVYDEDEIDDLFEEEYGDDEDDDYDDHDHEDDDYEDDDYDSEDDADLGEEETD